MPTTILMEKLLEIERSLGRVDALTLRAMLMDAQGLVVRLEEDVVRVLEELHQLRGDARYSIHGTRDGRSLVQAPRTEALARILEQIS